MIPPVVESVIRQAGTPTKGTLMQSEQAYTSPYIDDEALQTLLNQMRRPEEISAIHLLEQLAPVMRFEHGFRYLAPPSSISGHSFLFNQRPVSPILRLRVHSVIQTLHACGASVFFKPTIMEVFQMLPRDLSDDVMAFETIGPETAEDIHRQSAAIRSGYHAATTVLYAL